MAWLVVDDAGSGTLRHALETRCVLGRELDCVFRELFADRTWVSRHHACVERRAAGYYVGDLGSRNGTNLNGSPLRTWTQLRDGDRLQIGGIEVYFRESEDTIPAPREEPPTGEEGLGEQGIVSRRKVESWREGAAAITEIGADRKLRALLQLLGDLGRSLEADVVLDRLLEGLFRIFPPADRGFVATRGAEGGEVEIRKVLRRGAAVGESPLVSRTIVERVMREQEAILSIDARTDRRFSMSESVTLGKIRSVMCAPLTDGVGRAYGVLELDALDPQQRFSSDDLEVFACVAPQVALTLGYARLHREALEHQALERDLDLARRVQEALLPSRPPLVPGYAFHAFYRAAYQVGGDYYDYVPLPGGRWGILIADAFGKGVSAALFATKLSSELRTFLSTASEPAEAVHRMSKSLGCLAEELPCRFVTLALLVLDPSRHRVEAVNAGHLLPLLRRRDGRIEEIGGEARGPALGMFPERPYASVDVALEPGDVVMLSSDGFSEAVDAAGEVFGTARLREALCAATGTVEEQGAEILRRAFAFLAGERQSDDMTLLCIGREAS